MSKREDPTKSDDGAGEGVKERMAANIAKREAAEKEPEGEPQDDAPRYEPIEHAPIEHAADPEPPEPQRQPNNSRSRWREINERREAAERRVAELQAENAAIRALQEERRRESEQKPKADEPDKYKAELDQLKAKEAGLFKILNASPNLPADVLADMQQQADAIVERRVEIAAERVLEKRQAANPQRQSSAMGEYLSTQYQDIAKHPQATAWSQAYHAQQMAEGRPDSWDLRMEALNKARERFRTAPASVPRKPPDPNAAQRLSGAGAGPAGGSGGGAAPPTLTDAEKRMARTRYKHLGDEAKMYAAQAKALAAARAKRAQA